VADIKGSLEDMVEVPYERAWHPFLHIMHVTIKKDWECWGL